MPYQIIRAVVTLYADPGFRGRRCTLVEDTPDLRVYDFANKATSVQIHRGPHYDIFYTPTSPLRVSFNSGRNYELPQLVLEPGRYADLRIFNFNDKIYSVSFSSGQVPANPDPMAPIPLVAELYVDRDFKGRKLTVVHDIDDLHEWASFGDNLTSVKVFPGPDFTPGNRVRLFRHKRYLGGEIALEPGEYPNLRSSHDFNDAVSSVKVSSNGSGPIIL